jgi:ribonuclease Z
MAIQFDVLGKPLNDNALLVRIDSGQSIQRLLFDCGQSCLDDVDFAEIREIDHLFFSHLHMDHVSGFDHYFRCNYDRSKTNHFWGPKGTAKILQNRFQGYLWNLHDDMTGSSLVWEIEDSSLSCTRYELSDAFSVSYPESELSLTQEHRGIILNRPSYSVQALLLNHGTTSIGYIVREKPRENIDMARLGELGLKPGPWLKKLKERQDLNDLIEADGKQYTLGQIATEVLKQTEGESIAYLSDFIVQGDEIDKLAAKIKGCRYLVCESQYLSEDKELAVKNNHMTAEWVAHLARAAAVEELVLIHLSSRYPYPFWHRVLGEVKSIFPGARFAKGWER